VRLYRRPADATFVFCALLAIEAGHHIHRFITGAMPPQLRWQRMADAVVAIVLVAAAVGLASYVGKLAGSAITIVWGVGFAAAAIIALVFARRLAPRSAIAAAAQLAAVSAADLAFNNAPN
jgi:hypothetical protein